MAEPEDGGHELTEEEKQAFLDQAACMRDRGWNVSDPDFDGGGGVTPAVRAGPAATGDPEPGDPQFEKDMDGVRRRGRAGAPGHRGWRLRRRAARADGAARRTVPARPSRCSPPARWPGAACPPTPGRGPVAVGDPRDRRRSQRSDLTSSTTTGRRARPRRRRLRWRRGLTGRSRGSPTSAPPSARAGALSRVDTRPVVRLDGRRARLARPRPVVDGRRRRAAARAGARRPRLRRRARPDRRRGLDVRSRRPP